jgi:hypothetical protein
MTRAPPTANKRDYHSLIARAVASLEESTRDSRQALYERAWAAQTTQLNNVDSTLSGAEFKRERDALEKAIRAVELEATTTDTEDAQSDAKIVLAYAYFMANTERRVDCFYDVSVLPYPKEAIIAALERQIVRSPSEEHVNWLRNGALLLSNFLMSIGPDPMPIEDLDVSRNPRGDTPADRNELRRNLTSPDYKQDAERCADLVAIANMENNEIEERVAVAMRIRRAAHG